MIGVTLLASEGPPVLVGVPGAEKSHWLASAGAIVPYVLGAACIVLLVLIALRWLPAFFASGSPFAVLSRGLGLTAAEKKLLRKLAAQEGSPSETTLMLVPSAFIRESARAGRTTQAAPMFKKLFE